MILLLSNALTRGVALPREWCVRLCSTFFTVTHIVYRNKTVLNCLLSAYLLTYLLIVFHSRYSHVWPGPTGRPNVTLNGFLGTFCQQLRHYIWTPQF